MANQAADEIQTSEAMSLSLNDTIKQLHQEVEAINQRVGKLSCANSVIVPISSLAPEPYEVVKEIHVVVQEDDDEYIASFFDANVNAGGCNQQEAIDNLKDLLVSRFDYLDTQDPSKLARPLSKQIAVLREHIHRSANGTNHHEGTRAQNCEEAGGGSDKVKEQST